MKKKIRQPVSTENLNKRYAALVAKHVKLDAELVPLMATTSSQIVHKDDISEIKRKKCDAKTKIDAIDAELAKRAAPQATTTQPTQQSSRPKGKPKLVIDNTPDARPQHAPTRHAAAATA